MSVKFSAKAGAIKTARGACCVVGVHQSKDLTGFAARVDKLARGAITKRIEAKDFAAREKQIIVLYNPPGLHYDTLVLVGYGKASGLNIKKFREICAAVARKLETMAAKTTDIWLLVDEIDGHGLEQRARHLVEAMGDIGYRFDETKSRPKKRKALNLGLRVTDQSELPDVRSGMAQGKAVNTGVHLARDLANLPGNVCTPSYLAERADELQKTYPIKTTILDQAEMEELGMGALLSVSRGSRQHPKLIVMEYRAGPEKQTPVALVGKGLTFDAGGISLKPAAKMDEMKYDMCGGASVFGALVAAAELQLPINVVGVVPSSENLPDGDANKPGDVVTSMSGKTIEILNTDAEGRLILCDALTYTERFKPAVVIDIATLTGACVVALGHHASGLMSNNQELADEILAAGEKSLDRSWQLPLWDVYQPQLDSNFADIANIGGPAGGTITAACFLSRFTKSFKWAHLDIAGTAWRSGGKDKGATGRVVPLLTQFLVNRSAT